METNLTYRLLIRGRRGNSSVNKVPDYGTKNLDLIPGRFRDISFFDMASRPAVGPNISPMQWVHGALSAGGKVEGKLSCTSDIKNAWSFASSAAYICVALC
jgi:hypothetical protein